MKILFLYYTITNITDLNIIKNNKYNPDKYKYTFLSEKFNENCDISNIIENNDVITIFVLNRTICINSFINNYPKIVFIYPFSYYPESKNIYPDNIFSGISLYEKSNFGIIIILIALKKLEGEFVILCNSDDNDGVLFYDTYINDILNKRENIIYKNTIYYNDNNNNNLENSILSELPNGGIIFALLSNTDIENLINLSQSFKNNYPQNKYQFISLYSDGITRNIDDLPDNFYYISAYKSNNSIISESDYLLYYNFYYY